MTSVYPCSMCGHHPKGKLARAYWAWFRADGSRTSWSLRYCAECARRDLVKLLNDSSPAAESLDAFACVNCGGSAEDDSDPMYLTLYLPQRDPMDRALQLDSSCAAKLRIVITENGWQNPDRQTQVRGPSTNTHEWEDFDLGPG